MAVEVFDATARKFHQWAMVALIVVGFVLGDAVGIWLVAFAGVVMVVGRFWWPADIFRQAAWRWLEPSGILKRHDVVEDHETRRIARALGGLCWLASAALISQGAAVEGWALAGVIAVMVLLDAAFSFCALCFVFYQVGFKTRPQAG